MKRLPYIEDYILLMANHLQIWPPSPAVISLARYDSPIVDSMSEQIRQSTGLTDRQSVLAHKLVVKYKRQWAQAGYDVAHLEATPQFRLPIRIVDRVRQITVRDNQIEIRFPYDQDLIAAIRSSTNDQPGRCAFDKERRAWVTALIEPRVIWAKEFGAKYNFEFTNEFNQVLEAILGQDDYSITLRPSADGFEITNIADSLYDYILQHGGFGRDNIVRLIDLAGIVNYTVDPLVYSQLDHEPDLVTIQMLTNRSTNIEYDGKMDLKPIINYAELTKRSPIYVYESGSMQMRHQLLEYFAEEDIEDRKSRNSKASGRKVIYFSSWKNSDTNMPLLITSHTLMIGTRRQQMLQSADKIVYFTQKIHDHATMPIDNT